MGRAESNRRNSLRSTGPKTPQGKAKVSTNAVKHGAYSEALTLLLESPEDFQALRSGLVDTLTPKGLMETRLVDRLASLWWRMDRSKMAANQALWMAGRRGLSNPLAGIFGDLVMMSEAETLDADECRVSGAWDHDTQERLLRHELTLERSFFRGLHELERLQAKRQGHPVLPTLTLDVNLAQPD
jgi:hypothetical protein